MYKRIGIGLVMFGLLALAYGGYAYSTLASTDPSQPRAAVEKPGTLMHSRLEGALSLFVVPALGSLALFGGIALFLTSKGKLQIVRRKEI